ncbi:MAG: hypothetical protein K1X83_09930 [Oligoflexia bacterium]|nr:hypothetical protein [Oligoflexia bacterium]
MVSLLPTHFGAAAPIILTRERIDREAPRFLISTSLEHPELKPLEFYLRSFGYTPISGESWDVDQQLEFLAEHASRGKFEVVAAHGVAWIGARLADRLKRELGAASEAMTPGVVVVALDSKPSAIALTPLSEIAAEFGLDPALSRQELLNGIAVKRAVCIFEVGEELFLPPETRLQLTAHFSKLDSLQAGAAR